MKHKYIQMTWVWFRVIFASLLRRTLSSTIDPFPTISNKDDSGSNNINIIKGFLVLDIVPVWWSRRRAHVHTNIDSLLNFRMRLKRSWILSCTSQPRRGLVRPTYNLKITHNILPVTNNPDKRDENKRHGILDTVRMLESSQHILKYAVYRNISHFFGHLTLSIFSF